LIELNSAQTSGDASSTIGSSESASFQRALKKAAPRRDLSWFFSDWVDADKGLPDLTTEKVFPNAVQSGNWLVSVTVSNAGYAAAEVSVTARSATNTSADRILVPARGSVTKRILLQGKPSEVQVNDGTVPETQASVHVTTLDQPAAQQLPAAVAPTPPSPQ
jgi:CCR4-NOT transcriptional regulation complex NOT5 subunit